MTGAQLTGVSHEIGETAQKEAGFVSRLMNGEETELYAGYELVEEGRRQRAWEKILPTLRL